MYMIRELNVADYDKGYLELLMQLKQTMIKYDFETFKEILDEVNENKHHKIFVIEKCNKIIGTATILIETKFNFKLIEFVFYFLILKHLIIVLVSLFVYSNNEWLENKINKIR